MKIRPLHQLFDQTISLCPALPKILFYSWDERFHEEEWVLQFRDTGLLPYKDPDIEVHSIEKKKHPNISIESVAVSAFLDDEYSRFSRYDEIHFTQDLCEDVFEASYQASEKTILSTTPADLLWEITKFGELSFCWEQESLRAGKVKSHFSSFSKKVSEGNIAEKGLEPIPHRYYEDVSPGVTLDDIPAFMKRIREDYVGVSAPSWGLSIKAFQERIEKHFQILADICTLYPTYGDAILPDAHLPMTELIVVRYDGNVTEIVYETESHLSHLLHII